MEHIENGKTIIINGQIMCKHIMVSSSAMSEVVVNDYYDCSHVTNLFIKKGAWLPQD